MKTIRWGIIGCGDVTEVKSGPGFSKAAGSALVAVDDPPHVHQPLIRTIVDELNGERRCPSTGGTGARTTWVVDEILRGFRTASAGDGTR
jgi:hypothetical protein